MNAPLLNDAVRERLASRTNKTDGCWEIRGRRVSRHGGVQFSIANKLFLAHRIAWMLANGPIPDGVVVCHRCDNPPCVRVDHLFLGTPGDNVRDCVSKGRNVVSGRKLTDAQAGEIRRLYAAGGTSCVRLGKQFGVDHQTIHSIVRGRLYASRGRA